MYKSRFKYFGQTGYTLFVGMIIIVLVIGLIINFQEMQAREKAFMIYGGPLLLLVSVFVWYKILIEINEIEITGSAIKLKSLLTRKSKEVDKENILGYRDSFRGGYKILLIDKENKVCGRIYERYYKDFKSLIDNLGVKYLDREPDFWDGIFKSEKKAK